MNTTVWKAPNSGDFSVLHCPIFEPNTETYSTNSLSKSFVNLISLNLDKLDGYFFFYIHSAEILKISGNNWNKIEEAYKRPVSD